MDLAVTSSSSTDADLKFELFDYGKIKINAKPAVPLGTNFMSDVFITDAYLENGRHYTGFVKAFSEIVPITYIITHFYNL